MSMHIPNVVTLRIVLLLLIFTVGTLVLVGFLTQRQKRSSEAHGQQGQESRVVESSGSQSPTTILSNEDYVTWLGTNVDRIAVGGLGWTALIAETVSGNIDRVSLLLERGADPNRRDRTGQTALMYAAGRGDAGSNLVQLLISYGADINLADNDGNTALDVAKASSAPAVEELLRRAGGISGFAE